MGGTAEVGRAAQAAGPWITVDEAAERYAVDPGAIRAWVVAGRVPTLLPREAAPVGQGLPDGPAGTELVRADALAALPPEVLLAAVNERELGRLRAELAAERARTRAQAAALEAAQGALRSGGTRPEGALAGPDSGERSATASPSAGRNASAAPTLGWLAAGLLGFALRPLLLPSPSLAPVQAAVLAPAPSSGAGAVPESFPESPAGPGDGRGPLAQGAAQAEPRATPPSVPPTAPDSSLASSLDSSLATAPAAASAPSAAPEGAAAPAVVAPLPELPRTLASLAPLHWAPVPGPPCHFRGHGESLGPCFGARSSDGPWVAGNHRVDGVDCCAHHQLVMRLGGDLAQLEASAALARSEGVLPPLVAARIDRSARAFLRAACGPWTAAGIDAYDGEGHRVTLIEVGRARVETWVRLEDEAPQSVLLELELSDGAEGDVLHALVAGGTR